jgi:hypothetical protein
MRLLPRSRRGTWLLAGAVWLAASAGLWRALPFVARVVIPVGEILGDYGSLGLLEFSPDSSRVVWLMWPNSAVVQPPEKSLVVREWDRATGQPTGQVLKLPCRPLQVFAIPAYDTIPFGSPNRRWRWLTSYEPVHSLQLFDVGEMRVHSLPLPKWVPNSLAIFTPDNRCGLIEIGGTEHPALALLDLESRTMIGTIPGVMIPAAASLDGRWIVATEAAPAELSTLRIIDRSTLRPVGIIKADPGEMFQDVSVSDDGAVACATLITTHEKSIRSARTKKYAIRALQCWSLPDARLLYSLPKHVHAHALVSNPTSAVLVLRDGKYGTELSRFDALTGELRASAVLGREYVVPFGPHSFAQDRSLVCLDGEPKLGPFHYFLYPFGRSWIRGTERTGPKWHVALFDTVTCRLKMEMAGYLGCWSPDGRLMAAFTGLPDHTAISIWDIPPRKSLAQFAVGAALLAMPIAFVARRRVRKLRAA